MSRDDEIARRLEEMADLLEAKDVEYKPTAYRRAAEQIRNYETPIEELAAEGEGAVSEIPRVGDAIASKVVEYFETGTIEELDELRTELPVDMEALTSVEGVGPKTVGKLYEELGVSTLDELEAAAREGKIRDVSGFGAKTEENIAENIPFARQAQERTLLGIGRPLAEDIREFVAGHDAVERAEIAGSTRRWRETIGDVDVLAACAESDAETVADAVTDWDRVSRVIEAGTSKVSVRAEDIQVDLRMVRDDEFGAALQYFTGSRDHNIHLRNVAIDRDLKMNEYGVFDVSDVEDPDAGQRVGTRVGGETEAEMYAAVDLPLIPPELRENTGEIEAAREGTLPDLVEVGDVRGDLHTHTEWSDGDHTVAEMVEAAADFGHEYHVVSDHAEGPGVFGNSGLSADDIREQIAEIEDVREDAPIPVLTGIETNVDADGNLSTDDDVLEELDVVIASPHSSLDQDREAATERLVEAVSHPSVDVLGHPTGRKINERPGLDPDVERVAEAAADNETALEVNADPHRLDLSGAAVRVARDAGALVAVDTDAHRPKGFENLRFGVHTARRGWAEADDVLNARSLEDLKRFLH